jgi:hypothetical protein
MITCKAQSLTGVHLQKKQAESHIFNSKPTKATLEQTSAAVRLNHKQNNH